MPKNILEKIIQKKIVRIGQLKKSISLKSLDEIINQNTSFINFKEKIQKNISSDKISIIAEIKKASPSAGIIIDPNKLGIGANKFDDLLGRDAQFNANKMIDIFKGEDNDFSKAVSLNAAAGLIVTERNLEFEDAYNSARSHLLSGKTFRNLKNIQNV